MLAMNQIENFIDYIISKIKKDNIISNDKNFNVNLVK